MVRGTVYVNECGLLQTRFPHGYEVLQDLVDGELGFDPATGKYLADVCRDVASGAATSRDIRCNIVVLRVQPSAVIIANHLAAEVPAVRFSQEAFLQFLSEWRLLTKGRSLFDIHLAGKCIEANCELGVFTCL